MKGKAYLKTAWGYKERPVASAKLNTWDDRIESALALAFRMLSFAWGGGNGVLRGAAEHDLAVKATMPPGMSVLVHPGYGFIAGAPYWLDGALETAEVLAPVSQPRIDLVQARLDTWDVSVVAGTESATPDAPDADDDCIALARLYLRPGMTVIQDTEDPVDGYIIDERTFL